MSSSGCDLSVYNRATFHANSSVYVATKASVSFVLPACHVRTNNAIISSAGKTYYTFIVTSLELTLLYILMILVSKSHRFNSHSITQQGVFTYEYYLDTYMI